MPRTQDVAKIHHRSPRYLRIGLCPKGPDRDSSKASFMKMGERRSIHQEVDTTPKSPLTRNVATSGSVQNPMLGTLALRARGTKATH